MLAWCDSISVERTLDLGTLREFDNRILFRLRRRRSVKLECGRYQ
jgi:hypothetical protein